MPKTEITPHPVRKDILLVARQAEEIHITDDKTMSEAVELLSVLNRKSDEIENEKNKVMRPALDVVAAERARWKPVETFLKGHIDTLRTAISRYRTEAKRIADAEELKIAERVGPGKGKLKPETAIKQMGEIDRPEGAVKAESGSVSFRTDKCFEVVDISKLPIAYLLPNETEIRKAMKKGEELPGVRYYTEEVPINSRR